MKKYIRGRKGATDEERFWMKVQKTDTCWLWIGANRAGGYGAFYYPSHPSGFITHRPHRVAYEWAKGPIPEGLVLDHLCRVRNCVNPDHLEPVTNAENVRRGAALITTCPRGHALDYVDPNGHRRCRTCRNELKRLRRRARAEASA
jgi:hypothetical protein